ncbi:hypothetical protein GJU39_15185 [Pedobacter petrophilus]|uniref:Zinc-finger domain-containing protein n=1 Tax=Pedobacter petrophilus TaxID=1908241 RepID=A0A7K0G1V3_9SPHI|nr:hypothetical protein [Pedobacter petrophilus]MRX77430.1 hypothetical protein [Pedobacter petrophilus]
MSTIEQQLWDYVDGNLDAAQAKIIQEKIDNNPEINLQYEALLNLNLAFNELDLEEPSMSFARNVMESVKSEPAPVALKTKVNTNIIYGIGGFFVTSLLALFGYTLYHSNLKFAGFDAELNLNIDWNKIVTPTAIYGFLFIDLVIGLVFLDYLLRKKAAHK